MSTTLIVPGLHSSGPDHWQTWFEQHTPGSVRVIQRDWKDANLPDWASRVRREISRNPGRIFIAAHSFGALAAVQAANDHSDRIAGAMLVAPADPEKFEIEDHLPAAALTFRTVIVASTNDPWIRLERAAHLADLWGANLINLGDAGHINAESGFGPWPEGLAILERLRRSEEHAATNQHDVFATAAQPAQAAARALARAGVPQIHDGGRATRRALARNAG
jgi:predicted alpha/beta hydrolase family esterase